MSLYAEDLAVAIRNAEMQLGPSPRAMISTAHLILGILLVPQSPGAEEIKKLGFCVDALSKELRSRLAAGARFEGDNVWSEEAQSALKGAILEAKKASAGKPTTVHLLKAILADESSSGSIFLAAQRSQTKPRFRFGWRLLECFKTKLRKDNQ